MVKSFKSPDYIGWVKIKWIHYTKWSNYDQIQLIWDDHSSHLLQFYLIYIHVIWLRACDWNVHFVWPVFPVFVDDYPWAEQQIPPIKMVIFSWGKFCFNDIVLLTILTGILGLIMEVWAWISRTLTMKNRVNKDDKIVRIEDVFLLDIPCFSAICWWSPSLGHSAVHIQQPQKIPMACFPLDPRWGTPKARMIQNHKVHRWFGG